MTVSAADSAVPPPRSTLVTVLAWGVIVGGAILTPISIISFAMLLVGSYGTSTGGVLDWIAVVGGPSAALVAGIGLLRRKRWARTFLLALLAAALAYNAYGFAKGPTTGSTSVSPDGVTNTVLPSTANYSTPIVAICIGLLVALVSRKVRAEFGSSPVNRGPSDSHQNMGHSGEHSTGSSPLDSGRSDKARGWRVGHQGRDSMYYEESHGGNWQRIAIDGEMLMGRAHHVIYFASPERWQGYPEWARDRRDEIISRIKSQFRAPDYEYHGDGLPGTPQPAAQVAASRRDIAPATHRTIPAAEQKGWLLLKVLIVLFLGLAGGAGWYVQSSMEKGETLFPSKSASGRRIVARQKDPALFWTSIGIYSLIGVGSAGLAAWGIRETCRQKKSVHS
jgi:hypothetical protein